MTSNITLSCRGHVTGYNIKAWYPTSYYHARGYGLRCGSHVPDFPRRSCGFPCVTVKRRGGYTPRGYWLDQGRGVMSSNNFFKKKAPSKLTGVQYILCMVYGLVGIHPYCCISYIRLYQIINHHPYRRDSVKIVKKLPPFCLDPVFLGIDLC